LDSYGASLFDRYFCDYVMTISDAVRFEYDYALLARWLLKLSYNSARSVGSDVERLSRYALTIKDPTATLPDDFSMKADLVLPSKEPQSNREIIPASNRLCKISFSSGIDDWCTVRLVAINSYYFWILMQDKSDHSVNRDHAMAIVSKIPGVPVRRSYTIAQLRPSGATTFDMHSTWAAALRAQAIPDKM
jgi:hypothetical protein